jgi:hypothetical protein
MKNLLLGVLLLVSSLGFSQNIDEILRPYIEKDTILVFSTKNVSSGVVIFKQDCRFLVTKKGITYTMTNKKQIDKLSKYANGVDISKILLLDIEFTNSTFVTLDVNSLILIEGDNQRVAVRVTIAKNYNNDYILKYEIKDKFSGVISTMMYY